MYPQAKMVESENPFVEVAREILAAHRKAINAMTHEEYQAFKAARNKRFED